MAKLPRRAKEKCCILDNHYWVLSWSSCRKFWPSSATPGSHEFLFLFSVPSSHSPFCGSSVSPFLFPNQPPLFTASPFCCQWLWRCTVTRQMTHLSISLGEYSLKPTTLARYLHVEQEQAVESIHNYFKVDWDFCSQPPDNLCLEEKGGRPDVSNYGLKVLCIGLLEICCHPVQRHDAWPGLTAAGLQDVFSPRWWNVTFSAERKPGWLCKETSEPFCHLEYCAYTILSLPLWALICAEVLS